ncbi:photosystem II S4 domain protein [Synechococcus sp. A10-1-5-1]|uniref:photosystem II S4 domain protein n=1 Tax=Synechococcus sp. A10-1-5-1 TaxID=2936507 RepID=UPI0020010388|nr:photosystem II S4 domain protein [Synechococcus sp. A10-1-5-1]UPM49854.1 photosystem II S4 domain protein [Synechococcus sp. A10-1-5-1]
MLPRDQLLQGCRNPEAMGKLIDLAEQALRTWEPLWSDFLAADLLEEALQRLGSLTELTLASDGGWPQAERRRLLLRRVEISDGELPAAPLQGLVISGNFLFDPAEPADVRQGLITAGAQPGDLGDIWMRGDRGAQLILRGEVAEAWQGRTAQVRSVEVSAEPKGISDLQLPATRTPKQLSSVEASLRLDAVASAGLGVSRSKMADWIRAGAVRVNWAVVTSPSRELKQGDRIRLDGRGELEILDIQPTKRERWRLAMQRR